MIRVMNGMCPTCSTSLDDRKDMTITVDPPNEPSVTHTCGYSANMKDYNIARAQAAEDACRNKYPDMYPEE